MLIIRVWIRLTLPILFFALSFCPYASAEIIKLRNGREIEGTIVKETKNTVVIDIGGGEATFFKKGILSIDRTKAIRSGSSRKSENAKKVEDINSVYYSYADSNVESIEFVFMSDAGKDAIGRIKKEDYSDASDRIDGMKFTAAYDTTYDRLYFNVTGRPFFEDKKYRDSLDAVIKSDRSAMEAFWKAFKPYITKLIAAEVDKVKSMRQEGAGTVIETLNDERTEKKFIFNEKNELQSVEFTNDRYKYKGKETPKFELDGSKYLIKSLETEKRKIEPSKSKEPMPEEEKALQPSLSTPSAPSALSTPSAPSVLSAPSADKFEIEYQVVGAIKVPKSVKFSFQNTDPALSLPGSGGFEFSEVRVRLKESPK